MRATHEAVAEAMHVLIRGAFAILTGNLGGGWIASLVFA